jgi:signal transduction histidine kinase
MAEMESVDTDPPAPTGPVDAGEHGLPAIQRLVELCREALGAAGAGFVESGQTGGRVVAATGASAWAVGRNVDLSGQLVAKIISIGGPTQARAADQPAELAGQLAGRGIIRLLGIRVDAGREVVGGLYASFWEDRDLSPAQHQIIARFARTISRLYEDGRGLPVYADVPAVGVLADAIAVVGADGLVRSWNPAAATVTGRPPGTVLGRRLPFPLPAPGQVLEHRMPDGRWLQVLATELPDGSGRVVTLRDISEAHRREQARDLFVAVTSHELRTPVTVIKGYADTLADHWDELDEAERRDAAQRLGQRAGELARLVERLLSAVGDGSGLATPMPLPFDLAEALRVAVSELPWETRRLVRLELPHTLPKALGERSSLATVLSELVTNAVKHSPPDSLVTLYAVVDVGTVGFRVTDRGIGIRPEHVERAFERFWQAESGNERRYGGVGLGLYLVRRIIERQNGWVSLRPRQHGGTVAEVRLPRADLGPGEA